MLKEGETEGGKEGEGIIAPTLPLPLPLPIALID